VTDEYDILAGSISATQPVAASELLAKDANNKRIIEHVVSKALSDLNAYYPYTELRYVTTLTYTLTSNERFLIAYGEKEPGIPDYGYTVDAEVTGDTVALVAVPAYLKIAVNLTFSNIGQYPLHYKAFDKLVEIYSKIVVSNNRRKVAIENIGVDLKGDSFFSEAKEEYDNFITKLMSGNTSF